MIGGRIELLIGPMFSGKSTELIRRVNRYKVANYKTLTINYSKDTRYADTPSVVSHDKVKIAALFVDTLSEALDQCNNYDVIAIDEGQFFTDIVEVAEGLANAGKIVVVAGLDGTYERKAFNRILELIPLAESVTKINAVCVVCFNDASFTKRTVKSHEVELIGGTECYKSVCRKCYFDEGNNEEGRTFSELALSKKSTPEKFSEEGDPKMKTPCKSKKIVKARKIQIRKFN